MAIWSQLPTESYPVLPHDFSSYVLFSRVQNVEKDGKYQISGPRPMCDLRRWTTLSLLPPEFVDNLQVFQVLCVYLWMLQSTVVFGSTGNEVLMLTKDDQMFVMGNNFYSSLGTQFSGISLVLPSSAWFCCAVICCLTFTLFWTL